MIWDASPEKKNSTSKYHMRLIRMLKGCLERIWVDKMPLAWIWTGNQPELFLRHHDASTGEGGQMTDATFWCSLSDVQGSLGQEATWNNPNIKFFRDLPYWPQKLLDVLWNLTPTKSNMEPIFFCIDDCPWRKTLSNSMSLCYVLGWKLFQKVAHRYRACGLWWNGWLGGVALGC